MSSLGLKLPTDIPWQRIGVSLHMVDGNICDALKPLPMQPSVAVFEYVPPDDPDGQDTPNKVSYLKITCSIASYGATNLERLRKGKRLVTSPFNRDFTGSSSEGARQVDTFDSTQRLTGADLPCFGALIEISVGPKNRKAWSLSEYPYFSDFEPKKRELFELVSETGEIASRTLEGTGVLHGGTTSTSHEVFDKTSVGAKVSGQYGSKDSNIKGEVSYGYEEGSSNVDSSKFTNVRTVDAAREARETFSHTTQLSQMYQLLTSFHLGTNRAVFFVEPRPHIVQRDRSLIDGPRQLEGIQEFFLVVVRPRTMDICVNASLETLHIGAIEKKEDEESPPVNTKTAELVFPRIGWNGSWKDPDDDKTYLSADTRFYTAEKGWVIDRAKGGGYEIPPGGLETAGGPGVVQYKVDVTDQSVTISAQVNEHHIEGGWGELDRRESGYFALKILIHLKREVLVAPPMQQFAILTNTSVCTCRTFPTGIEGITRMEHEGASFSKRLEDKPSIVREVVLPMRDSPLGQPMTAEAAHEWRKSLSNITRSSMSSPDRYPRGSVDFWDLDVMRGPLEAVAKQFRNRLMTIPEAMDADQLQLHGLAKETTSQIKKSHVRDLPIAKLLRLTLHEFVSASGLNFEEAAALRGKLWEFATTAPAQEESLQVPNFTGMGLDEAKRLLVSLELGIGSVERRDSSQPSDVVLGQSPMPDTQTPPTTRVDLVVSTGLSVRLPHIIGLGLGEACCRLRDSGMETEPILDFEAGSEKRFIVHRMNPLPGTYVTPHSSVRLKITQEASEKKRSRALKRAARKRPIG